MSPVSGVIPRGGSQGIEAGWTESISFNCCKLTDSDSSRDPVAFFTGIRTLVTLKVAYACFSTPAAGHLHSTKQRSADGGLPDLKGCPHCRVLARLTCQANAKGGRWQRPQPPVHGSGARGHPELRSEEAWDGKLTLPAQTSDVRAYFSLLPYYVLSCLERFAWPRACSQAGSRSSGRGASSRPLHSHCQRSPGCKMCLLTASAARGSCSKSHHPPAAKLPRVSRRQDCGGLPRRQCTGWSWHLPHAGPRVSGGTS